MHNFDITRREIDFHGRKLIIETGKMAKQANGSVYLQLGETSVLVTATMSKDAVENQDFFPLTVDFIEKMYASVRSPADSSSAKQDPQRMPHCKHASSTALSVRSLPMDSAIRCMLCSPFFPMTVKWIPVISVCSVHRWLSQSLISPSVDPLRASAWDTLMTSW